MPPEPVWNPVELTLKQWLEWKQWHSDANLKYPETMCNCSCRFILNICWQILAEHPEPFICEATSSLPPKVPHTCNLRPAPRAASHRTSASWRDPGPCLRCLISYYSTVNSNYKKKDIRNILKHPEASWNILKHPESMEIIQCAS